MKESHQDRPKRLIAQSQAKLADLLSIDLDLAFTFLETAAITTEPERPEELIEKATRALESIRYFLPRLHDPQTREEIEARAEELEKAIAKAPSPSTRPAD